MNNSNPRLANFAEAEEVAGPVRRLNRSGSPVMPEQYDANGPASNFGRFVFVKIPYVVGGVLLLVAIAINFANVIARYVFFNALFWAEEILVYMVIWGVFISAAAITYQDAHLKMDLFSEAIRGRTKKVLSVLITSLMVVTAIFVVVQSFKVVSLDLATGSLSVAAGIPMAIPASAMLVGFSLITLAALVRLFATHSRRSE